MLTFVVRRGFGLFAALLAASAVIFIVLEVLPGDSALLILGVEAREDTLAALRAQLGLDQPAPLRYLQWVGGFFRGQLGTSHTYAVSVGELVADRLVVTVPLAAIALTISTVIAIPLGVFAAANHQRAGDYGVMGFSQLGMAMPSFWFGILFVLVFSVHLGWFPSGGFPGWSDGVGPAFRALVLPAVALALPEAAILARVTRSAVLETLRADFIRTARAKGLHPWTVLFHHALRNALVPIITIFGLQFAFLLAGSIVVENVFFLPGLGRLIFQAVSQRDIVVVRDVTLLLVALVVVINFLVDIVHVLIDPRPHGDTGDGLL